MRRPDAGIVSGWAKAGKGAVCVISDLGVALDKAQVEEVVRIGAGIDAAARLLAGDLRGHVAEPRLPPRRSGPAWYWQHRPEHDNLDHSIGVDPANGVDDTGRMNFLPVTAATEWQQPCGPGVQVQPWCGSYSLKNLPDVQGTAPDGS